MKMSLISLLTLGRTLDHAKDRTGAYSLRKVNEFSKLGTATRPAAAPSAPLPVPAGAPVEVAQPTLFEAAEPEAPAAVPSKVPAAQTCAAIAPDVLVAPRKEKENAEPSRKKEVGKSRMESVRGTFVAMGKFGARPLAGIWRKFRKPAADLRPRAQAELALEKVTVIRNDLSDADLVVVAAPKQPEPAKSKPAVGPNPWARATARWINLKAPAEAAAGTTEQPPSPRPGELARTPP